MLHAGAMQTPAARPDRTLLVILSIIAAVAILALVVVFTRGTTAQLDRSSPEGVVQAYTAAVIDGKLSAITPLLSKAAGENCERVQPDTSTNIRVTLVSTKIDGDHAPVHVLISTSYGSGPFGDSGYETEDRFMLVNEGGQWLVDSAPWQFTICYNTKVEK